MIMTRKERLVASLPPQCEVEITYTEARKLIEFCGYRESIGLKQGEHYRRAKGKGCFHLRTDRGMAYLHWDSRDPGRFSLEHLWEFDLPGSHGGVGR